MQSDWMFRAVRFESTIFNSISNLCRTCCRARAIATNGFLKRKLAKQVLGFGLRIGAHMPAEHYCRQHAVNSYGLHLEVQSLEATSFHSAR